MAMSLFRTTRSQGLETMSPYLDNFTDFLPESLVNDNDDVMYNFGIGLSEEQISQKRQRMLNLADRLRSAGAQAEIDIPQIAVIGSQSAGKSSLLQRISGVRLPRSSGTCTRVPTEILLKQVPDGRWQCTVTLRYVKDAQGNLLGKPENKAFGPTIYDQSEVEDRLRRAQLAVLNPSRIPEDFLLGSLIEKSELSFSDNCVSVQIQGPHESNLSLCDLPGLIASVAKGGRKSDIKMIEGLVKFPFHAAPAPIAVVSPFAKYVADFETQGAFELAARLDPEGKRTLGVLTKPDRIASGDEERWVGFVKNEEERLELGWYCVKQPDFIELARGITWQEARDCEEEFFKKTEPWCSLPRGVNKRLGTKPLIERLSQTLSDLIARRLPKLQRDIEGMLRETEKGLRELPASPSEDSLAEVMHLITQFYSDVERHISGSPEKDGLIQKINVKQVKLKRDILFLAPQFKPFRSDSPNHIRLPSIEFLEKEEVKEEKFAQNDRPAMHIDEVMTLIAETRTRELPGCVPYSVPSTILESTIGEWQHPAGHFFEAVYATVNDFVNQLVGRHFRRFEYGGLFDAVQSEVQCLLQRLGEDTKLGIEKLFEREKIPFTLNAHYLTRYKDDFLAYHKGCRQREVNGIAMKHIQKYALMSSDAAYVDSISKDAVSQVLAGLNTMSIRDVKASDLPKLLPKDPYEPALELMATVSAYYQVSSKRFIDNVSLVVDFDFVRAFARDIQKALYSQLTKGDPRERCAIYLQESPTVHKKRSELQGRLERLTAAKRELMGYSIW